MSALAHARSATTYATLLRLRAKEPTTEEFDTVHYGDGLRTLSPIYCGVAEAEVIFCRRVVWSLRRLSLSLLLLFVCRVVRCGWIEQHFVQTQWLRCICRSASDNNVSACSVSEAPVCCPLVFLREVFCSVLEKFSPGLALLRVRARCCSRNWTPVRTADCRSWPQWRTL